jgi:hypothetical protein
MIRIIAEVGQNIYSVISVSLGAISGVVIAVLNSKSRHRKIIDRLHSKLDEQRSELAGLKKAFSIVYDAYEREFKDDPNRIEMLKDLKKEYNL